ncbi:MAG: HD domain-containing phosphohydrolase [Anaerolineales bacterium]
MRQFLSGLRFRLFLSLMLVTLPLAGVLLSTSWQSLQVQKRHAEDLLRTQLTTISVRQETLLDETQRYLAQLASLEAVQNFGAACDTLLQQYFIVQPAYSNMAVVDMQGNVRCSARPLAGPVNVADTSWFGRARRAEGLVAGDFQIGRVTGKPTLILAYPITVDGERRGFVTASLNLDWLPSLVSRLSPSQGDVYMVLDSAGTVLARWPDPSGWVGRPAREESIVAHVLGRPVSDLSEMQGLDGIHRIYAFAPWQIGTTTVGYIVLGFERERIYGAAERRFFFTVFLSIAVLLTSVILAWPLGHFLFLRHIDDLREAVHRLAEGDLQARTRLPYGIGELSVLARDFDNMAGRLEKTLSLLNLVLTNAPIVLFALDREGRFTLSQGKALQSLGLQPNEVVGRPALELYADFPEIVEHLQKALAGEEQVYVAQLNGLAFLTRCLPMPEGGVVGIAVDISELERARAQLELQAIALQESADAIIITDRQGVILWVNRAFTRLSGYTAEEALGQTSRLMKSGLHDADFYRHLWETILSGQVWEGDVINRRKDGTLYEVNQVITPVRTLGGEITHFVSVQRDIGERRRAERLAQAEAMLTEALSGPLELQPLLDRILQAAMHLTPAAEKGSILLLGADDRLHIRAVHGYNDPAALTSSFPLTFGYSAKAFRERRPLLIADVRADGEVRYEGPIAELAEIQSAIVAPLIAHDRVLGVISLDNISRKNAFSEADLQALNRLAGRAALLIENLRLIEQTRRRLQRIEALRHIDQAIAGTFDQKILSEIVVREVTQQLSVHAAGIWLYQPDFHELHFSYGEGFQSLTFSQRAIRLGRDLLGEALLKQKTLAIQSADEAQQAILRRLFPDDEFQAAYVAPMIAQAELIGVLAAFHRRPQPFLEGDMEESEWVAFLEALAGQASIAIQNVRLFRDAQRMATDVLLAYDATIEGWSRALEFRDCETHGHTQRVLRLTLRLAEVLGVPDKQWPHIRRGVLLHDIGKIAIPDEVLRKPGSLTPQEWEIMRRHPQIAYDMLQDIDFIKPALEIPYCHHEKWDGSGYPRGLKGEQIPLAARIFAVVDVWDALTSDRPYRKALSPQEALEYIRSQSGKHFDPRVVEAFEKVIQEEMAGGKEEG